MVDDDSSPGQSIEYGVQVDGATANITTSSFSGFDATQAGSGVVFSSAAILEGSFDTANPSPSPEMVSSPEPPKKVSSAPFPLNWSFPALPKFPAVKTVPLNWSCSIECSVSVPSRPATWSGGIGDDTVLGGSGNDFVAGEDGNDIVKGDAGDDVVDGGAGNDIVVGGTGNDQLFGGSGNDYLAGEQGNDRLVGGPGDDTFAFSSGSGMDRIGDFRAGPGEDHIELSGFTGIASFNDVLAHASDTSEGTLITFNANDSVLLEGVQKAQLTTDDFTFF